MVHVGKPVSVLTGGSWSPSVPGVSVTLVCESEEVAFPVTVPERGSVEAVVVFVNGGDVVSNAEA